MKRFSVVLFILVLVSLSHAQQTWMRTYGGTNDDWGLSVQQTTEGGYIVAGTTNSFGNGSQVYLIKVDSSGAILWTKIYGGIDLEVGNCVQQTSDGGYIIAGFTTSFGAGGQDVYLIKTNAYGDTLWTRTYGGPNNDYANSVQQTLDGGYVIAGTSLSFGVWGDVYLIRTNGSGDTLWTKTYGGSSLDHGNSVQQTIGGGYIIAGYTDSFGAGGDVFLIKTNSSGDTLWTRTFGGTYNDFGNSVQLTSDGGYIIAGGTNSLGAGNYDIFLIKANSSGNALWTRIYGGTNDDRGYSVQQTADDGFIITGYTSSFGAGGNDVCLIKTDANGNVGVETPVRQLDGSTVKQLKATPNPFTSFTTLPGHTLESFSLYDISGRRVGVYKGDRIGEGLRAGVYFLKSSTSDAKHLRIVKLR